jgi:hypothetical protein
MITQQELSWDLLLPKQSHKQTRTPTSGSSVSAPAAIVTDQQGQCISPLTTGTKDSTAFGIDQQLACSPPHLSFDPLQPNRELFHPANGTHGARN